MIDVDIDIGDDEDDENDDAKKRTKLWKFSWWWLQRKIHKKYNDVDNDNRESKEQKMTEKNNTENKDLEVTMKIK